MVCVLLAALLLQPPGPTPPVAPAMSASAPGSPAERRSRAQAAFESGSFAEAAVEYEALWREGHGVSNLFNAAASRFALRHHAHAAAHLEAVLATRDLTAAQREEAGTLLKAAQAKLVQVPLELRSPRPLGGPLPVTLSFVSAFASDIRPDLTLAVDVAGRATLALDPGLWRLRVDDPRFEPVALEIRVAATGTGPQVVDLRSREDPRRLRRFALGWGVSGAAGVISGAAVLGVGQGQWGARLDTPVEQCQGEPPQYPLSTCRRSIAAAGTLRATGAAILGIGAGSAVSGLIARVREPRKRRIAWSITSAAGALAVVGGGIALGFGAQTFTLQNDQSAWTDTDRRAVDQAARTHTIGAAFVGLGGGLLAGSLTGLVLDRRGRFLVSGGPQVGPGRATLLLEGRF